MGVVRTKLLLSHSERADLAPIEVEALVDLGAVPASHTIPASFATGLRPAPAGR